jgi:para-nitrobenzyl esterase
MAEPRARTATGVLQGKVLPEGVLRFTGIPYAAPPVGDRRFRPPAPAEPWSGIQDAVSFGPGAPQNASTAERLMGAQPKQSSEDCLTLNVWTPGLDDAARPVMVWLHGGAFATGSGGVPWYHGNRLAARGDVVVVTLNYRLGALGFLHLAQLLGGEYAAAGNLGLLDQIAALEWVSGNIAAFGGDPGRVTIFGESAGGMSVATLLGAPAARGRFQRAIAQSGAAANVSTPEVAAAVAEAVVAELHEASGDNTCSAPEILLEAPVGQLLAAQDAVARRLTGRAMAREVPAGQASWLPFQPVVDGTVLPEHPLDAIAAGAAADVPLITGTTSDEWRLFHLMSGTEMSDERLARAGDWLFGEGHGAGALDVYRRDRASAVEVWNAVATDWAFRLPAIRLAEAHARHQPATYVYEFAFRSTAFDGALGACHAIDIPFVWDNLGRRGVDLFLGPLDERAHRLAAAISGAWLAFARTGDPGHEGLPAWSPYAAPRRATMVFDPAGCRVLDDPGGAERQQWSAASGVLSP